MYNVFKQAYVKGNSKVTVVFGRSHTHDTYSNISLYAHRNMERLLAPMS